MQFTLNLLGDPELNVWTDDPIEFTANPQFQIPESLVYNEANVFNLNTGDPHSKACLIQENGIVQIQTANYQGVISFTLTPTSTASFTLTVTGNNRIPFVTEIPVLRRCITGSVTLASMQQYQTDVNVELLNNFNVVLNSVHPDASGAYVLSAPSGVFKVRYSLFNLNNDCTFYPQEFENVATYNVIEHTMPAVSLYRCNLTNVNVSVNPLHYPTSFRTLAEALDRVKLFTTHSSFEGQPIIITLISGEYHLPNPNGVFLYELDFDSVTHPIVTLVINGSGAVTIPTGNGFNFRLNNVNLTFSNIKFMQGSNSTCQTFSETSNSSFTFNNCHFGVVGIQAQYRIFRFIDVTGVTISNCNFKHLNNTVLSTSYVPELFSNSALQFYGCSDVTVDASTFEANSAFYGGALFAYNSGITIQNGTFLNNSSLSPTVWSGYSGGAVLLRGCTDALVEGNMFNGNTTTGDGGPLCFKDCSQFNITGNTFKESISNPTGLLFSQADAMFFDNCVFTPGYFVSHNIITGNNLNSATNFIVLGLGCTGSLNIANCNFIKGSSEPNDNKAVIKSFNDNTNVICNVTNCIFATGNINAIFDPNGTVNLKYSICRNGYTGVDNVNPANVKTNVLDMNLDGDYVPVWNATVKSLCIDSGDPDLDIDNIPWYKELTQGDREQDGRLDIGAKSYFSMKHRSNVKVLKKSEIWNWISVPAIDYTGASRGADHEVSVFDTYMGNKLFRTVNSDGDDIRILDHLTWMYNGDLGDIYWRLIPPPPHFVFPTETHHVKSQYGYKIQLRNDPITPNEVPVEYSGFLPGCAANPSQLLTLDAPPIYVPGQTPPFGCIYNAATGYMEREVWLGYFLEKNLHPFDALAPVLNNIVQIKAQDWCLSRKTGGTKVAYSNEWEGVSEIGPKLAINFGEMVAVRYIGTADVNFEWAGSIPNPPGQDPFTKDKAEHFAFSVESDYLPIYATIDLSGCAIGQEPKEIAVYINGVCKGAEKITSADVQIKSYIMQDPDLTDNVIEFVLWSPTKAEDQVIKTYAVMNNVTGRFETRPATTSECGNYIKVSLKPEDIEAGNAPAVTLLSGNYPNPFNPETYIKYQLALPGTATLEIYNSKGQRIRTLVNENKKAGFYNVKWDGKDNTGTSVSSGVYFYRLSTNGKSLTKKMLMMK